jgi:hypothetical protein
MATPVREMYLHSVAVPRVLDSFCEELLACQQLHGEYSYSCTLALAHLSLQLSGIDVNPYSLENKSNFRRVLIRLSIFYHLMYSNEIMQQWGALKNEPCQYVFVWEQSAYYDSAAESIHLAMSQPSQFNNQQSWIEWIRPRLGTLNGDVELNFQAIRSRMDPRVNDDSVP